MGVRYPRPHSSRSQSSSASSHSYSSDRTWSTAPTVFSERPALKRHDTSPPQIYREIVEESLCYGDHPCSSVETYASTVPPREDLTAQPPYEMPLERIDIYPPDAVPTTPPEFAELFEASRRFLIQHDDSTLDGNMNLRVDTEVPTSSGRRCQMTLFHLRLKDLHDRRCSLRRYCRESGREVCHSARTLAKRRPIPPPRPTLRHAFSSAMQTLGGLKSPATFMGKKREGWRNSQDDSDDDEWFEKPPRQEASAPSNSVHLEFSNYAQVEIHARGTKRQKRYDFEYWGNSYYWAREFRRDGKEFSYHLINATTGQSTAHILPESLSKRQVLHEEYNGGWVPPCSMFITDKRAFGSDLAEVMVATGLMALVDDCIRRRWHNKSGVASSIPVKKTAEYFAPKRLMDGVLNRRGHTVS